MTIFWTIFFALAIRGFFALRADVTRLILDIIAAWRRRKS